MRVDIPRALLVAFLLSAALIPVISARPAAAEPLASSLHFPKPPLLSAHVDFWQRIYTEFGVGDFVLHDRENLAIVYDVVRVGGITNEARAALAAAPEVRRVRAELEGVLSSLARGVSPEALGVRGQWVAQLWGCPCSPEILHRAAGNIRAQQGLRERVDEGLQRARSLMPKILSILRRRDVPLELAALPLVESAFNPRARSKAGAVGLWQFILPTGKRYMNITRRRDDRLDPLQATEAAARLLKHNYEALGSWPLALLAYNHGQEGILAARAAVRSSAVEEIIAHYRGPRFGFASRNFYLEFLAALEVVHPVILAHSRSTEPSAQDPAPQ